MSKIMLVEDDNNLREIYEARLLAEGYEIVSAHDGEEALAMAVKEKPDLIISDVMMPKISGFDMLDILRSTPETRDTKVIMMTALSQAEDKSRADKLGADRYLVKSQVTLEDVAKIAREVLEGVPADSGTPSSDSVIASTQPDPPTVPSSPPPAPVADPVDTPVVVAAVAMPPTEPAVTPMPAPVVPEPPIVPVGTTDQVPEPIEISPPVSDTPPPPTNDIAVVDDAQTASAEQKAVADQVDAFVSTAVEPKPLPAPIPEPVNATPESETPKHEEKTEEVKGSVNINGKKVISPISDPAAKPDLNKLLADEEKKSQASGLVDSAGSPPPVAPGGDPNLIAL